MIADNPLLGPEWEPLGQSFARLIEQIRKNPSNTMSMQTYGRRYSLSPHTSPFVQACIDSQDRVQVEVSANLQVRPELTPEQFNILEFYGWLKPYDDPIEGINEDENPNFSRYFEADVEPIFIAEFVLTSLVGVYEITLDDFFGFPSKRNADRVAALKKLGRLKSDAGNPDGVIFAMPGKHLELLEPQPITGLCTLSGPPLAKPEA